MSSSLTKEQILKQAANENIPLSKHMLDKYINWGLLKGEKRSLGRQGSCPSIYPRAMESIRLIHQLNTSYKLKHKDIIFILYWRGLPVGTHILMNSLREYQQDIQSRFHKAHSNMQQEESLIKLNFFDLAREELLNQYTSPGGGRLKKSEREQLNKDINELVLNMFNYENILNDILTNGRITPALIAKLTEDPSLNETIQNQPFQLWLEKQSIFHLNTWINESVFINTESEETMDRLVKAIRKYWSVFITSPFMQSEIGKEYIRVFNIPFFTANPIVAKFLLFLLMANGETLTIINFLESSDVFEYWIVLSQEFSIPLKGGDTYA